MHVRTIACTYLYVHMYSMYAVLGVLVYSTTIKCEISSTCMYVLLLVSRTYVLMVCNVLLSAYVCIS